MFNFARPIPALTLVALVTGASTIAAPAAVRAHGDLHGQIQEVSRQLAEELRKPVDGHERAKFFLERGELYRIHGEWKLAEADYDQAAHYEPDNDAVLLCRGRMLLESGQPERALPVLDRFLARNIDHAEGLFTQAQVLVKLGWGFKAVQFLDRAIRRHPQPEPDHYLARADVLLSLPPARGSVAGADRRVVRAIRGLDEGIKRLGPLVSLDEKAIELELRLRRHDRVLARIDRQSAVTVRKDMWLARRADVLEQAGRPREARQARARALQALSGLPMPLQHRPTTEALRQRLLASQAR